LKDTFYIRYSADGNASWCVHTPQAGYGPIFQGTVEEGLRHGVDRRIVVLVPSTDITLTTAELPEKLASGQTSKIQQAVPFILEERLADDVETLHFAIGPRQPGGIVPVAIINREKMQAWLAPLQAAGLKAAMMVPDVLAIPLPGQPVWSVLVEGDRAQVRTGIQSGFSCERQMLPDYLSLAEKPQGLQLQIYPTGTQDQTDLPVNGLAALNLRCDVARRVNDGLEYLLRGLNESQVINLLQGGHATHTDYEKYFRPWRAALVLLGIWMVLATTAKGFELLRLKRELGALDSAVTSSFKAAFPQVALSGDVRTQARQQLAVLERGGTTAGFLPLMQAVSAVVGKNPSLKLQEIQYRDGALLMSIDAPDVQALDAFQQAFSSQPGVQLEVQSANAGDQGVQIRARLKAAKA
jgi:general secretion pathway protein L